MLYSAAKPPMAAMTWLSVREEIKSPMAMKQPVAQMTAT